MAIPGNILGFFPRHIKEIIKEGEEIFFIFPPTLVKAKNSEEFSSAYTKLVSLQNQPKSGLVISFCSRAELLE